MSDQPPTDGTESEGIGCRPAALTTAVFLGFSLAMLAVALLIGLDQRPSYPFLFAGGPVTGLLTSVGGDLAFSWPLDLTVWVVAGFAVARSADDPRRYRFLIGAVMVAALVLGVGTGLMIEPT